MTKLILTALVLIAQTTWAIPKIEISDFLATTKNPPCGLIESTSQLVELAGNDLAVVKRLYARAEGKGDTKRMEELSARMLKMEGTLQSLKENLSVLVGMEVARFQAQLSEDVSFPVERLTPANGRWEIEWLASEESDLVYLQAGDLSGRLMGGVVCSFLKDGLDLESASEAALNALIAP